MARGNMRMTVACGVPVLVLATGVAAWHLHKSRTFQLFGDLVVEMATEDSVVALTFDDGPGSETPAVLDLLRENGVRATFFVIGQAVAERPDLAHRILHEGHELGNHSWSHRRLVGVRRATIREEVERTDSLLLALGAAAPIPFRPPYGKRLIGLPWYLAQTGRTTVLWSLEPDTWYTEADAMAEHVLGNVRPGAIVLLHVELRSREQERAALRTIIERLAARGYRFVTVSELLSLDPAPHVPTASPAP